MYVDNLDANNIYLGTTVLSPMALMYCQSYMSKICAWPSVDSLVTEIISIDRSVNSSSMMKNIKRN